GPGEAVHRGREVAPDAGAGGPVAEGGSAAAAGAVAAVRDGERVERGPGEPGGLARAGRSREGEGRAVAGRVRAEHGPGAAGAGAGVGGGPGQGGERAPELRPRADAGDDEEAERAGDEGSRGEPAVREDPRLGAAGRQEGGDGGAVQGQVVPAG